MKEFIARQNIKRFEEQLKGCADPKKKATLEQLLVLERAKLDSLARHGSVHRS